MKRYRLKESWRLKADVFYEREEENYLTVFWSTHYITACGCILSCLSFDENIGLPIHIVYRFASYFSENIKDFMFYTKTVNTIIHSTQLQIQNDSIIMNSFLEALARRIRIPTNSEQRR